MRILLYLRRALQSWRFGVGGAVRQQVLQGASYAKAIPVTIFPEEPSAGILVHLQNLTLGGEQAITGGYQRFPLIGHHIDNKSHLKSLLARSSKRNGPFVLTLAGGNSGSSVGSGTGMRILLYLRRALASRAAGVGGPQLTFLRRLPEPGRRSGTRGRWRLTKESQWVPVKADRQASMAASIASLPARSSKRNGPFVPVFAGGNS